MRKRSLYKSRKFKYGSAAAAFTAFFIAVFVVFNAIFGALASYFGWYIDMTGEKVFTLSGEAREFVSDITDEVNIYFAQDPDVIMADNDMRYIYKTATQLEEAFPNIHVECRNVVKNPGFFEKFYNSKGTEITQKSVIVESGTESTVYLSNSFFTYNENGDRWAYNGEYRFISAIMQLTQSKAPIAYFTTGHAEDVPDNAEGGDSASNALSGLLSDCGFDVRTIDLTQEKIDDDARIIVIYNPKYDFIGNEAESENSDEIRKIDDFLDGLGGLIVFEDPEYAGYMNNLGELLSEWGISFRAGTNIADSSHSMSTDALSVLAKYDSAENAGGSFYREILGFESLPKSIIRKAMPVDLKKSGNSTSSGTKTVSHLLTSYDSAELRDTKSGEVIDSGEMGLAAISYETRVIDNDFYYSYVMAAGSPSFASSSYLSTGAYGNRDIIFSAMKLIGRSRVLADLPIRPFDDTSSSATTAEANSMTVEFTLILPLIIAAFGGVVIIRRRHS